MNSSPKKYRSTAMHRNVIAFSISYQRENLLARGLGIEHVRELLIRLARPILRQGASLAYGGNWKETNDNFTYDLLRLISAEQEDNSHGGAVRVCRSACSTITHRGPTISASPEG